MALPLEMQDHGLPDDRCTDSQNRKPDERLLILLVLSRVSLTFAPMNIHTTRADGLNLD